MAGHDFEFRPFDDDISDILKGLIRSVPSSLSKKPPESLISPHPVKLEFVETTPLPSGKIEVRITKYRVLEDWEKFAEGNTGKQIPYIPEEQHIPQVNPYARRSPQKPVSHDMLPLLPRPLDYYPPKTQDVIVGINSFPLPKYDKITVFALFGKAQLYGMHREEPEYSPDARTIAIVIAGLLGFIQDEGKYRVETGTERVQRCLDRAFKNPRLGKIWLEKAINGT